MSQQQQQQLPSKLWKSLDLNFLRYVDLEQKRKIKKLDYMTAVKSFGQFILDPELEFFELFDRQDCLSLHPEEDIKHILDTNKKQSGADHYTCWTRKLSLS